MPPKPFRVSPCSFCGSVEYRLAPFTTVMEGNDATALHICNNCGMTTYFTTALDNYANYMKTEYYEHWTRAKKSECKSMPPIRELIDRLEKYVPIKGKSVLDVGCGEGQVIREFNRRGAHAAGIEPMTTMAEKLRAEGLEVYNGFLSEVAPKLERRYDVVSLYWVLEAMKDPFGELKRIGELLKPHGVLWMTGACTVLRPYFKWSSEFGFVPLRVWQKPIRKFEGSRRKVEAHPMLFSHDMIIAMLELAGFDILYITPASEKWHTVFARPGKVNEQAAKRLPSSRRIWAYFVYWKVLDLLVRPTYDGLYRLLKRV